MLRPNLSVTWAHYETDEQWLNEEPPLNVHQNEENKTQGMKLSSVFSSQFHFPLSICNVDISAGWQVFIWCAPSNADRCLGLTASASSYKLSLCWSTFSYEPTKKAEYLLYHILKQIDLFSWQSWSIPTSCHFFNAERVSLHGYRAQFEYYDLHCTLDQEYSVSRSTQTAPYAHARRNWLLLMKRQRWIFILRVGRANTQWTSKTWLGWMAHHNRIRNECRRWESNSNIAN